MTARSAAQVKAAAAEKDAKLLTVLDQNEEQNAKSIQKQLRSVLHAADERTPVSVQAEIGRGAFGVVYRGIWKNIQARSRGPVHFPGCPAFAAAQPRAALAARPLRQRGSGFARCLLAQLALRSAPRSISAAIAAGAGRDQDGPLPSQRRHPQ